MAGRRDFAAANCDYLFTTFSEMADAGKHVADIRERAAKIGREVGAYTVAHVVCRETQAEADAYYERYAVTLADHAAVDEHMAGKKEFSQSHDKHAYDQYRQRFAGGAGSYPLVGTPQRIAAETIAIAEQGYEGIALTFVNYTQELPISRSRAACSCEGGLPRIGLATCVTSRASPAVCRVRRHRWR